jgi:hypothetical protein
MTITVRPRLEVLVIDRRKADAGWPNSPSRSSVAAAAIAGGP